MLMFYFLVLGMMGAALFLVGLSFMDCTQTGLAVALLTIAVTLSGTAYSGFLVNHMDIAPKFAGTLFGISNGLASCSGFIAPPVAAAITKQVSLKYFVSADLF
jgi:ACS family sodium-dependent inorganic phosphate cotransporter-like MFS transporter 5